MTLMVVLRLVHILGGVFWAGTLFFQATYLEPSMRASMPESGKVMQQLLARRLLYVLPIVALLTILSGFWLLWKVSGGMDPTWMRTGTGRSLSIGGAAALLAYIIGMAVMRRAQLKAVALARAGAATEAEQARLAALRRRVTVSMRWVAALLAIAVVAMAIARYV